MPGTQEADAGESHIQGQPRQLRGILYQNKKGQGNTSVVEGAGFKP